jgi:hypothetical protein
MEGMSKYSGIIDLPHPAPRRHARMPLAGRAAQFSPFAALVGFEELIEEETRLTEEKMEGGTRLTEEEMT